jgi:methylmalonyl-CoA mutase N-terminal domain/subunit
VVGVNRFAVPEEQSFDYLRINPEAEAEQVKRLGEVRKNRDNARVKATLQDLRASAEGDDNLMPIILKSVKEYATLGEICDVLRDIFDEYKASDIL